MAAPPKRKPYSAGSGTAAMTSPFVKSLGAKFDAQPLNEPALLRSYVPLVRSPKVASPVRVRVALPLNVMVSATGCETDFFVLGS